MKFNCLRNIRFTFTSSYSFLFIISLFICSCAQQLTPNGGAYDKTPPKVMRYHPDSAALNFNSRSIDITFDEYVQLSELNSQLLISPPLEYAPDISIKKKTLSIVFDKKEVLKPNSTYSISLGKAVRDIHESTPIEDFRYIFSTGSFIDSLSISGNVLYAFDHKTEKNIMVMLYSDLTDSAVYKKQPDYFTRTNDFGAFKITNIRPGKYRIVALKDDNNNYKYDGTEVFGFLDSLSEAGKSDALSISLSSEVSKKIFVKKNLQEYYGKFLLVFNHGSDSLHLNILNKNQFTDVRQLIEYSKMKDSITLWMDHVDKDSLVIQSLNGQTVVDTVKFKLIKKEAALKNATRTSLKFGYGSSMSSGNIDLNNPLAITFSHPLLKINDSIPVLLKEDTLDYKKYPLFYKQPDMSVSQATIATAQKFESKKTTVRNHLLKENTNYSLFIPPGTFTDFFGLKNDTIKIKWRTKEEKYYGTVELKLKFNETSGDYIVQLLDDKENVVRQNIISKPETIYYDYLYPQAYKLKVIFDKNKNGRWDAGNYLNKQQPEKVVYNTEVVTIRSNWDLELEWTITEPN